MKIHYELMKKRVEEPLIRYFEDLDIHVFWDPLPIRCGVLPLYSIDPLFAGDTGRPAAYYSDNDFENIKVDRPKKFIYVNRRFFSMPMNSFPYTTTLNEIKRSCHLLLDALQEKDSGPHSLIVSCVREDMGDRYPALDAFDPEVVVFSIGVVAVPA